MFDLVHSAGVRLTTNNKTSKLSGAKMAAVVRPGSLYGLDHAQWCSHVATRINRWCTTTPV